MNKFKLEKDLSDSRRMRGKGIDRERSLVLIRLEDRDLIRICLVKRIIFSFDHKWKQLEHENVNELVLVTLRGRVEEGKRFSNEEKDPITSKELNGEPYEVKISCTVL